MNESVIPLAGSSFSKLGPLDVRVRIAGDANPEDFRWVALRVASVDLLQGSNQQHALFFFQSDGYSPPLAGGRENTQAAEL